MAVTVRILKFVFCFLLIFSMTSCASSKKNSYMARKKEASRVDSSKIGRNKYYFSSGYQKKLNKSYKRKQQ